MSWDMNQLILSSDSSTLLALCSSKVHIGTKMLPAFKVSKFTGLLSLSIRHQLSALAQTPLQNSARRYRKR